MKLYYFPLSTYSQKAVMAFHEKHVAFEPEWVPGLLTEEGRAAYRKIYPLGKIPLLVLDDGWKIPESSIIIEYLDQHYDRGPRLIPADPDKARQMRFIDRVCDLYLNDSIANMFFESLKPESQRNAETIARAQHYAGTTYAYFDRMLENRTWLMGDDFTMADCAAAPPLFYAQKAFPFEQHANLAAYAKRVHARPSYQKVLAEALPLLDEFTAKLRGNLAAAAA